LQKLIGKIRLPRGKINAHTVGFQISPRLNAASRMDHANQAFELLNTDDPQKAEIMAEQLNQLNTERQVLTEKIYNQAIEKIGQVGERKIIICHDHSWSPGLVGLVAGRVCDLYYRPVILIGHEAGKWIGSGRSIEEFDITAALHRVEEHFSRFGVHRGAGGFDLKSKDDLAAVEEKLSKYAQKELGKIELMPSIKIEAEIPLEKANFELAEQIFDFAPFGMANPQPIFVSRGLTVVSFETMGSDLKHLKVMAKAGDDTVKKLVGFNISERIQELKIGAKMDLVYELGINEWNGNRELQFKIVDFMIK
jgi:single-stranded-DNA-specific exonuclease